MIKKTTLLFAFIFSLLFFGQKSNFSAPDYSAIEKEIKDKNSDFYYPDLLKKLKAKDTTITEQQYQHLYYGYLFQSDYNPNYFSKKHKELTKYYNFEGELKKEDIKKAIAIFESALDEFPLDLRVMNFLAYLYHENGNDDVAAKISHNFNGLLYAIISTGDGLSCATGFHVISISHEYVFLNMHRLQSISQSYDGTCDYLKFEKDKYAIPGLYFNVSKLSEKRLQGLKGL